jgi:hypothetical protein
VIGSELVRFGRHPDVFRDAAAVLETETEIVGPAGMAMFCCPLVTVRRKIPIKNANPSL